MPNIPVEDRLIPSLLRIPFEAVLVEIDKGLKAEGFDDISPAHFVVFNHIDPDGVHAVDLASRARMTKQSMGYLVNYLEKHGYVERIPNPDDGRAKLVRLTPKGWKVDQAARKIAQQIESEWGKQLGQSRMDKFTAILRDLVGWLEPY